MRRPPLHQQVTFCYVPDIEAADAFYHGVLGLPLILDQGFCRIYQVTPAAFVGFCQATDNIAAKTSDDVILTLVVDTSAQVDEWAAYLQERDAAEWIERGPVFNERFNIYHLFMRDPAGNLVEIQAFLDSAWPRESYDKVI